MESDHDQHHFPNPYGTNAAPPPTPSTQPNLLSTSADALSRLLHGLPPNLSLPKRRSTPLSTPICPPLASVSDPYPDLLSASSQLGFFQLTNHSISSQLAQSAESDSLSLFNIPRDQRQQYVPKSWPIGFHGDEDDTEEDDDENGSGDSLCLDSSCSTESSELPLNSLREFTREIERVGMEVIEALSCVVRFSNPLREDPNRVCSLVWISVEGPSLDKKSAANSGKIYPCVIGLQYQIRSQKSSILADSGWVSVLAQVDSILVTLGDIAQVWSNGKLKKVRGRPVPCLGDGSNNSKSKCISMSLLVTLPLDSIVSPLCPTVVVGGDNDEVVSKDDNHDGGVGTNMQEERLFKTFSFEDYAWRVYNERLLLKDPLDRYRSSAPEL